MISFCNWPLINNLIFVGAAVKEFNGLDGRQAGTEAKSGSCFPGAAFSCWNTPQQPNVTGPLTGKGLQG